MDREQWVTACAAVFEGQGYHLFVARDYALTEFLIRCCEEPIEGEPQLPVDRWPDPAQAAREALEEMALLAEQEG